MWQPAEFPYKELPGLSKKLLADHFKLYHGYIERLNKIEKAIKGFDTRGDRFELQRLVLEDGFLRNAARLHELYFEQLAPKGAGSPEAALGEGYEPLLDRMSLMGLGSTGWVVLALDLQRGERFLFSMKEHGQGYVAESWPVLVLDVYEHSYMTDYQLRKDEYIDAFFRNVDWRVVDERLKMAMDMVTS